MNLTLTNLNIAAGPKAVAAVPAASEAGVAPAPVQDVAAIDTGTLPAAAQPALAFAQWLGLDQGIPALDAGIPVQDAALPAGEAPAEEQAASATESPMLGAMAMPLPLMPVAQVTLAAVAAALPGVPVAKEAAPAADTEPALPAATDAPRGAAATVTTLAAALPSAPAPLQAAPAAAVPMPAKVAAGTADGGGAAPFGEALASTEAGADGGAAMAERAPAGSFGVAAPAPGNAPRGTDTVTLSGPPTAWRQSLQEALGERLQLQVGKGAEQAVIKLEPPMLGRVEIAIRHSAGALEVHISATHGEVLRQLQSVSENLRNDLAQRQFTDVAVNVAPAPRGANAAQQFAGDTNGRGRQQDGREQEQTPGHALAEANTGASSFSLNGRA